MSRIYDSLKKLEQQRKKEHSKVIDKAAISEMVGSNAKGEAREKKRIPGLMGLLLSGLFLVLLGTNIRVLLITRNYSSNIENLQAKLISFESTLKKSTEQTNNISNDLRKISVDIEKINSNAKDALGKAQDLEKSVDSNEFAITNLTKAKNELFKKLNEVTVEVDKLRR